MFLFEKNISIFDFGQPIKINVQFTSIIIVDLLQVKVIYH